MTAFSAWGLTLRQVRDDTVHASSYSQLNPPQHQHNNTHSDTEHTDPSIIDHSDSIHYQHYQQHQPNCHSIGCLASREDINNDKVMIDDKEEAVAMETAISITASTAVTFIARTSGAEAMAESIATDNINTNNNSNNSNNSGRVITTKQPISTDSTPYSHCYHSTCASSRLVSCKLMEQRQIALPMSNSHDDSISPSQQHYDKRRHRHCNYPSLSTIETEEMEPFTMTFYASSPTSSLVSLSQIHPNRWLLNDSNESLSTLPTKLPALLRLPAELILEIMEWLPSATFFALTYTCRRCYQVVAHEPNLHYTRLYRWHFPTWRTEHTLLDYWRDTCELSDWRELYYRRCRLETAWRRGHWQYRTRQLPGRDDMTARSLLVNAGMGATVAARAGGHLVHVSLPHPRSSSKSLKVISHASYEQHEQAIERVADYARGPVELRANSRYLLALVHNQGRIGITDATLWCVRSLRFLARIPMGSMTCRLMGRHIIRVHTITGKTSIIEAVVGPVSPLLKASNINTTSGYTSQSPATSPSSSSSPLPSSILSSPTRSRRSILAPGVHLVRHQLPKLNWNWDVVTADTTNENIWLIAGGSGKTSSDHCSWAILQMAPTPTYEEINSLTTTTTSSLFAKLSLKARVLRQDTIQLYAMTTHVLEAQLDDQFLLFTGSANPRSSWHRTGSSLCDTTGHPEQQHHLMSDVLLDDEAIETVEKTGTEAYRWLHVCSLDGRHKWRRHFTLGCVRGVRLHASLDRVCVHLSHKKLCILRASDGILLGEMDFFGGALLYHVLGPICVSVDQGRMAKRVHSNEPDSLINGFIPSTTIITTNTDATTTQLSSSIERCLLDPPVGDDGKYTQRLIVYDLVRVQIIGVHPLPVDQSSMLSGSFSFAVSPVQLAFRDARSSLITSVIFDEA
jgi:hypothetical protein